MRRDEKGYALINVLVAIAIAALIALGASMTVGQMITSSQRNSDWTIAMRQAQSVGYWISQDALMANTITVGDDTGTADIEFVTLDWKDWETGDTCNIRYIWLNSSGSLKKLHRKYVTHNKDGLETANRTTLVADNIYTANLTSQNDLWKLSVEARSGNRSASRIYEIDQRQEV